MEYQFHNHLANTRALFILTESMTQCSYQISVSFKVTKSQYSLQKYNFTLYPMYIPHINTISMPIKSV